MACFLYALRARKVIINYKSRRCAKQGLAEGVIVFEAATEPSFSRVKYICKYLIMATAAVQYAPGNTLGQVIEPLAQETKPAKHNVSTTLNYYQDPGDGTLPAPFYVG